MIRFKKIKWKNFLSTGDQWTEVKLDDDGTTLIVGANGAGTVSYTHLTLPTSDLV